MSDPDSARRVLVVGGGPVGLGLAIELGQRGIPVTLVERYPEPSPIPRGQNLTQRTMEHMLAWGCEAELRAARTVPPSFGIGGLTAYGTLLGGRHYDWLQRERVRPYYATDNERLPQYATEAVLRARVALLPSVETLFGWRAESLAQDDEGVSVEIAERGGAGRRTLRGAYAVGCDGSRSTTREAAGITQTRADHDRLMVLLVFRSRGLHALLERFPGKSFFNVLHPRLEGYWQFFGRVDLGSTWFFHAPVPPDTSKDADFRPLLFGAAGEEFDVEMMHVGFWDLRFALADRYRAGRVLVAGDAAHSHPPYGGYGINTGFEDARNLGWKLAAALDGWAGPGLLDSYDAERRPVFASTARDFIERSISADRDFLAAFDPARDEAAFEAAWAERASGTGAEVGSFEPNYEGSPVVAGEGGSPSAVGSHRFEARAGHHLAPAALSDGRDVHDALGPGFTLLAFEGAPHPSDGGHPSLRHAEERPPAASRSTHERGAPFETPAAQAPQDDAVGRDTPHLDASTAFAREAERLGVPLTVVRDDAADERARYGAPLVLVRPDHFVAWSGEACDAAAVLGRAVGR